MQQIEVAITMLDRLFHHISNHLPLEPFSFDHHAQLSLASSQKHTISMPASSTIYQYEHPYITIATNFPPRRTTTRWPPPTISGPSMTKRTESPKTTKHTVFSCATGRSGSEQRSVRSRKRYLSLWRYFVLKKSTHTLQYWHAWTDSSGLSTSTAVDISIM